MEEIGSDIVFILPTKDSEENPMKQFEILFKELDKNLAQLNIATYGLSDTTLEEVGQRSTENIIFWLNFCKVYLYFNYQSGGIFTSQPFDV